MKKILIILLALCLFIPVVLGNTSSKNSDEENSILNAATDMTGGSSNTNLSDSGSESTTMYSSSFPKGIRISFVTSTGEDVFSKDYMLEPLTGVYYHSTKKRSKVNYISTNSGVGFTVGNIELPGISEFEKFSTVTYAGISYTYNINFSYAISNNNYTGLFSALKQRPAGVSDFVRSGLMRMYFENILKANSDKSLRDFRVISSDSKVGMLYDLFIVIEPIAVVKINGNMYIGTAYELAHRAHFLDGGGFQKGDGTFPCVGSSSNSLCDLSDVLKKIVPCTSYLDGNISNEIEILGGERLKGKFTSSSYFNGAISIKYGTANSVCNSSSTFSDSDVLDGSGIGMGVVWMSGLGLEDGDPEEPLPPDKKYNCTPQFGVGTCINGESINYTDTGIKGGLSDENYWKHCVFNDDGYYTIDPHKESNKNSALTYYESSLGSQYCEVYCVETLTTKFASGNITVEAGSRFMWGYSDVTGGRTCKTKSVNWTKFYSDLKTANQNIIKSYANWKIEENRADALANNVKNAGDCGCVNNSPNGVECCTADRPVYSSCAGLTGAALKECKANPPIIRYECIPGAQNYEKIPKYSVSWSGYTVNGKYYSGGSESWCGNDKPSADVAGKQATYSNAVDHAESLVQDMKKCYTWPESSIYNTNPKAIITYSDGKNYYYSGNMDTSTSYLPINDNSKCDEDEVEQIKGCEDNNCPYEDVSMLNCGGKDRYVEMTRTATTVFSLNDDIFRYVLKSNNLSIHRFELPKYSNSNFTTNYYDVGEPNFPVSYSIPDGVYGSMHGKGNLDLTYSNLGHLKAGQTRTDVDNILSAVNSADYGNWRCEFNVYSKLIPDPGGSGNGSGGGSGNGPGDIRVVYRTIDLVDPFPDIDGSRRNTGSNWCNIDGDCSYNNNTVKLYINNNRGVDDYDIYSGDPMYTFILTPKIIKEIRRYNSVNSYADYTGSLDGKNYDYKCNNGTSTGKYCISDYLSYIIDITGAKNQPGSCVDDKYRNYNDTGNFEACRY